MAERGTNADVEGSASELSVDARVVTLSAVADASARLDGVRRLTVPRKAIVTPAVRDLLRERKIELAFGANGSEKSNASGGKSSKLRMVVGAAGANWPQLDVLMKLLARSPMAVELIPPAGLTEMIDELAKQLAAAATVGVLLTAELAAAACLANRLKGVRAMAVGDAGTLAGLSASARAIGANLLIIDPTGRSPFAIKPWIERFCQGAPRACPPQWQGRLD